MTSSVQQLLVQIDATTEVLRRELARAERPLNQFERKTKVATTAQDNMSAALRRNAQAIAVLQGPLGAVSGRFSALGSLIGAVNPLLAVSAVGFAATATAMGKAVAAAESFERAGLKTEAILRATGGASGQTADGIRRMSQEIARATLASTQGVETAAQKLLTFRSVTDDTFRRTLELSQDLAEVGFGSIETAAVQLGKALENPATGLTALTRVGVTFSARQKEVISALFDTGDVLEAQALLLDAVEKQVGGAGRAAGGGLTGAYDSLGQSAEELLEKIGRTSGALSLQLGIIGFLDTAIRGLDLAVFGDQTRDLIMLEDQRQKILADIADAEKGENAALAEMGRRRLDDTEAQIVAIIRLQEASARAQMAAEGASKAAAEAARAEQDADRAAAVEAFNASLREEVELLKLSDAERGKRQAADKAVREASRDIIGIKAEHVAAIRAVAEATEAEKQAIKAARDEAKARAKDDAQLLELRRATVAELQAERDYQIELTAAHLESADAVNAVEDAQKAYLVTSRLKLSSDDAQYESVIALVSAIEEQKRATRSIIDAQREAAREAEKLAREQEAAAKKAAEAYGKVWENALEDVQRTITNSIENALSGNLKSVRDFADEFLAIVRRLAANLLAQRLVIPVMTQAAGGLGLPGGMPGGMSGGGLFGGGGMGGMPNPMSMFGSGFQNVGSNYALGGVSGVMFGAPGGTAASLGVAAVPGGVTNAATAGLFGAGGSLTAAGALGIAGIVAGAVMLGMQMFGRKPSVGPTTVGRVTDLSDPGSAVFTFDNGGDAQDLVQGVIDTVSDNIRRATDRFAGALLPGMGMDFGFFASPESGNRSGQAAGFNIKAIIDGVLEETDRFRGLSEEEAVSQATLIALREMVEFQSKTLTAIQTTGREDLEGFIADLEFGRDFDLLRDAIADLGGEINASTLAMADLRAALQRQGEEQAQAFFAGVNEWLGNAVRLFAGDQFITSTGAGTQIAADIIAGLRASPPQFDEGSFLGSGGAAGVVTYTGGDTEGGLARTPSGVRVGDDQFFETRWNHSIGRGVLELLDEAGEEVIGTYSGINEMLGDLGNVLGDLASATEPATEKTAEYWEQLARTADSIDIAKARVDQFFGELTGSLEPAVVGQFEARMIQATAAIEASRPGLEEINRQIEEANDGFEELAAALIDVQGAIDDATVALRDNLAQELERSLQQRLNAATGLGAANAIDNLVAGRAIDLADAAAFGIDAGLVANVFEAELRSALSSASLGDLARLLGSGQVTDDASRAIIELMIQEQALAAARVDEISGLQSLHTETERFARAASDNARTLRNAAQSLLTDQNLSPLSPELRLEEARRQLDAAFALATDNDPMDDESQEAIRRLPQLSQTMLEASRAYYGATEGYLADFNRAQSVLNTTALRQETIEQQQLSKLLDIENALVDLGVTIGAGIISTQTPAQQAVSGGFNFGTNTAVNQQIYNALVAAGLPTPAGFGPTVSGNIGDLRRQNPAVDALVSALGFSTGGGFTVAGPPGNDNLLMPLRLTAGEAVNVHRGDTMQAVVKGIDRLDARFAEVVQINRALLHENAQQARALNRANAQNDKLNRRLTDMQAAQPRRAYG